MLNIRTLQILVEVARQGGFSRAAQTVHAVQPTVSKAVQAVEDRLGVRIFERANNGVRLTVEGEIVYRRALNILQEFEALEADVAALHKLEKGVLRGSRSCRHPSPRPAEFFVAPDSGRTAHGHHAPGSSPRRSQTPQNG